MIVPSDLPSLMLMTVGSLVLLVAWLLFESSGPSNGSYLAVEHHAERVSFGKARLRVAVPDTRAGPLQDDDRLDEASSVIIQGAAAVSAGLQIRSRAAPFLDRLTKDVDGMGTAPGSYKAAHALLENPFAFIKPLHSELA